MLLSVRVSAGARREKIEEKGTRLNIAVKEPAEGNRANRRALQLLASHLGVPQNRIRMISGSHSPSKKFEILEK